MQIVETFEADASDIDQPLVTVTLSVIEALNLECAVRGQLRSMTKTGAETVFVHDAAVMLMELEAINAATE